LKINSNQARAAAERALDSAPSKWQKPTKNTPFFYLNGKS
jgi:hypothetical protein